MSAGRPVDSSRRRWTNYAWIVVWAAAATLSAQASSPQLVIRVCDFVGVPDIEWRVAQETARQIYQRAGIDTLWTREPGDVAAARRSIAPDGSVVLNVMPRGQGSLASRPAAVLGAVNRVGATEMRVAYVFTNRIEQVGAAYDVNRAVVLGHAIAHEVGHVVIGVDEHAPDGLMRASWGAEELREAVKGRLNFTAEHAAVMQHNLRGQPWIPGEGR